ncbi:hypothetical protein AKJ16_DCAP13498, partial [Drosera capensis]
IRNCSARYLHVTGIWEIGKTKAPMFKVVHPGNLCKNQRTGEGRSFSVSSYKYQISETVDYMIEQHYASQSRIT